MGDGLVVNVSSREITWCVTEEAARDLKDVRTMLGDGYNADVALLRERLCLHFSSEDGCTSARGNSIRFLESTADGGKVFKVRWMVPGSGSSGGLRLAFVVYCDTRRVVLCRGWMRKEDPGDKDFSLAGPLAARHRGE
jgi:hypothetical protein